MRCLYQLLRLCLAASSLISSVVADDPAPVPDAIGELSIRLPELPSDVVPPAPQPVTVLSAEHWYIVDTDIPVMILASRQGFVTVTSESIKSGDTMKLRGRFADGNGSVETRIYTGPDDPNKLRYIGTVEAAKQGEVELLVIPAGAVDESVVLRRTLSVLGARPPPPTPDPIPPVPPEPVPPTPPEPVASFRVIFVKESGATLSAEQNAIPGAKAIRDYLNAKTTKEDGFPGWREYDLQVNTTNEQPVMKALWVAVKSSIQTVPSMIVEVNGHATVRPFPANVAEALTVLKLAGGE